MIEGKQLLCHSHLAILATADYRGCLFASRELNSWRAGDGHMQRRTFLRYTGIGITGAAFGWGQDAAVGAPPKKKKRPDRKRGDGNRDGKNTVQGALWQFEATDARSNKQIKFRYRAADYVLYELETGEVIGTTKDIAKERSLVVLNDKSPFPGTFEIRFLRLSHWVGQFVKDDADWRIKLTCLDR
jgi:hypothetical protein